MSFLAPSNPILGVITPGYLEPANIVERNVRSVQTGNSDWRKHHLIIWDGVTNVDCKYSGLLDSPGVEVKCTRFNHDDYGDYVRRLGTRLSITRGFDALTFLDADNAWTADHWDIVLKTKSRSQKNIIITGRSLIGERHRNSKHFTSDFFDTNTMTFFGNFKRLGLFWGLYPKPLSLVGDRIISGYIQTNFAEDIAYTNEATVHYSYSTIPVAKVNELKSWFALNYQSYSDRFREKFGFDLDI